MLPPPSPNPRRPHEPPRTVAALAERLDTDKRSAEHALQAVRI
jgi:hypothetical protein